jgi:sucrose-phosphate synthase
MDPEKDGLYILMISVHGLIRGEALELGVDADTGGQTKYVIELARALGESPGVGRVDLLTRRIQDPVVSADYGQETEALGKNTQVVRLPAGPDEYLRKEVLWDHLDNLVDNTLAYLQELGRTPDIIHAHYADAGYVGSRIASHLGVPLIFTGHSLGRVKRRRLLAKGQKMGRIEEDYQISRRIAAEEETLALADRVIASSSNELAQQYKLYDYYHPEVMRIVPPGTDLQRFHPPTANEWQSPIWQSIKRFLDTPEKPFILALSRPDERKNITTLLQAYGQSKELQELANLVIIAGNRDSIIEMEEGPQKVMTRLLLQIDCFDLYGKVAYPKHHDADDVPILYRLATSSRGVFINPALTEPFGLTLIEAAASGLPVVATEDGGPQDIIRNCNNGLLVDPLDGEAIVQALLSMLQQPLKWQKYSSTGVEKVIEHYSWQSHAEKYLQEIEPLCLQPQTKTVVSSPTRTKLYFDRAIVTELDDALLGDRESLQQFVEMLEQRRTQTAFAIATGRSLHSALALIKANRIPLPDVLITSMGTEIYYAPRLSFDVAWKRHINHLWYNNELRRLLNELPGLELQPKNEQQEFKISYYVDHKDAPSLEGIVRYLHQNDQTVNAFLYQNRLLDIIPIRASKGHALRYFCEQWEIPLERVLVAGSTAAEEDMMRGNTLGSVVSTQFPDEVNHLSEIEGIYFTKGRYAKGILEAIEHYDFYGRCAIPPDEL